MIAFGLKVYTHSHVPLNGNCVLIEMDSFYVFLDFMACLSIFAGARTGYVCKALRLAEASRGR